MIIRQCLQCWEFFSTWPYNTTRKFCSSQCYHLSTKGKATWTKGRKATKITRKKESLSHMGELNHKFKIRIRNREGYYYIHMPEHPNSVSRGYFMEHRYMAECCLGRFLESSETIHHINGIKDDNHPGNLYLFLNSSEHRKFHINPYPLKSNLL